MHSLDIVHDHVATMMQEYSTLKRMTQLDSKENIRPCSQVIQLLVNTRL